VDRPAAAGDGVVVVVVVAAAVGGGGGAVDGGFDGDNRTIEIRPRSPVEWWPASRVTCSRAACLERSSAT